MIENDVDVMGPVSSKVSQWKRVHGPDLCPRYAEVAKKVTDVLNSQAFKDACSKVNIPATRRQASKFRRKFGKAYKLGRV